MAASTETTDKGIGLAIAFAVVAVLGAFAMFAGAPNIEAAWGFAAAVLFGGLAVAAIHAYWG